MDDEMIRAMLLDAIASEGVLQVDLAEAMGITDKHLSRYLRGHCGMSHELLDRAAAALGRRWSVRLVRAR